MIRDLVKEAMTNAAGNGYSFIGHLITDIAVDMKSYDAALEDYNLDDIIEVLEELNREDFRP